MRGTTLNQNIKQVGFVIILTFVLCIIIVELNYFISSILGAITLYLLFRKPMRKLEAKGWSTTMASTFFLIIATLVIFLIGTIFVETIYVKMKDFHPQKIIENVLKIHNYILAKTGYSFMSEDIKTETQQAITPMLPGIFSATGAVVINSLMMIFILFFMLKQSRKMEKGIEDHLPLSHHSIAILKHGAQNMVVSNAIVVPVIIIVHALAASLIYWILGIEDPLIWGWITGACGLIPVVGTAVIWVPLAIDLIITKEVWAGIFLLLYGSIIISSGDSIVRMFFMKKYAHVHPLITIFGVILGLNLFGFWGIIFGPLVISGFLVMIKIYKNEFLEK